MKVTINKVIKNTLLSHKLLFFFQIVAIICISFSMFSFGFIFKNIINSFSFLNNYFLVFLILNTIFFALSSGIRSYCTNTIYEYLSSQIKTTIYNKIIHYPDSFFNQNNKNEITTHISNSSKEVARFYSITTSYLIRNILFLTISLFVIFFISLKLSGILLTSIPFIIISVFLFKTNNKKVKNNYNQSLNNSINKICENIRLNKTIYLNQSFAKETQIINNQQNAFISFAKKKNIIHSIFFSSMIAIFLSCVNLTIFTATIDLQRGNITSQSLFMFIFFAVLMFTSFVAMADFGSEFIATKQLKKTIDEILNYKSEEQEQETVNTLDNFDIVFKNVSFFYNQDDVILKNLNLTIKQGKKVALIGQSGIGKSTIASLLTGILKPTSGEITISNHKIQKINKKLLLSSIYLTSEINNIFSTNLIDNITYPDNGELITKKSLNSIIKKFNLNQIKESFENFNANKKIGDKGEMLSIGERQRILNARTLLKDAKIYIFDESISSIDPSNRKSFFEEIKNLSKDKTVIFITHHIEECEIDFDEIINLNDINRKFNK